MHFTIYAFAVMTVFYALGSNPIYGVLLFFVSLTIIIFYQDIYTYIIYGGALTIYALVYISYNSLALMAPDAVSETASTFIYQGAIFGFYLVFLIYFVISENTYDELNNQYVETQHSIEKLINHMMYYLDELNQRNEQPYLHENVQFQEKVKKTAEFLATLYPDKNLEIKKFTDFYFYLHQQNIETILLQHKGDTIAKYTKELSKFLMNQSGDLMKVIVLSLGRLETSSIHENTSERYNYSLSRMFSSRVNKIIAISYLYHYLRLEKTQMDKWGRYEDALSRDQIESLLSSSLSRQVLSFDDANFMLENKDLLEKYLG